MPTRKRTADTATVERPSVELDSLFRKNSKARTVAERLLSGKQMTRQELVEGLSLSQTTVPRVIDQLESVGVKVARDTDPHTRHASYQVVEMNRSEPEHPTAGKVLSRYVHQGGDEMTVKITKIEVEGGEVWATYEYARFGTYRGLVVPVGEQHQIPAHLINTPAKLSAICVMTTGKIAVQIGDLKAHVLIAEISAETAPSYMVT
jgi:biotin operon repressor